MAPKKKDNGLTDKYKALAKFDLGITTLDDKDNLAQTFRPEDMISSDIPLLNLVLSATFDGGLQPGIEVFAAPSGTGKTSIGLKLVEEFQKKYKDYKHGHITLFFDGEFGGRALIEAYDLDESKILHIPIRTIEEMHHNMLPMLEGLGREKVFIFVDSVGNLASKKELEDALEGKSVADMTRAKSLKAFFRQVTPYINLAGAYSYFIGHVYKAQGLYPKTVVSGGTGLEYAPNGRYMIGRADIKDVKKRIIGHEMGIIIDKSRTVKHKMRAVFQFMYGDGILKFSGMPELAVELGFAKKGKIGNKSSFEYDDVSIEWREAYKDEELWNRIFEETDFKQKVESHFKAEF